MTNTEPGPELGYELTLLIDGKAQFLDTCPETLVVQTDDATHRCRACSMRVLLDPHLRQWVDEDGGYGCAIAEPAPGVTYLHGPPHEPELLPFTWCEDITLEFDPRTDTIQVTIGLRGRGVVSMAARQIPNDPDHGELAGHIVVHTPCQEGDDKTTVGIPTAAQAHTIG